jgi:hypothetical protein
VRLSYNLIQWRVGESRIRVELYLGCWVIGGFFEREVIGIELGPLRIDWERDDPPWLNKMTFWSRQLLALTVRSLRLVIHIDLDSNIWRAGYLMAAYDDHGIYLGPLNVQIEFGSVDLHPDVFKSRCRT